MSTENLYMAICNNITRESLVVEYCGGCSEGAGTCHKAWQLQFCLWNHMVHKRTNSHGLSHDMPAVARECHTYT